MTEPEQPDTPPLTRKQMRDLRNTGATPVVTPADTSARSTEGAAEASAAEAVAPPVTAVPVAPLPRAAAPAVVSEPPVADMAVDLGVAPLTRRQARQQERIRTASVPVITPDAAAAHLAGIAPAPVETPEVEVAEAEAEAEVVEAEVIESVPAFEAEESVEAEDGAESALTGLFADAEPAEDPEVEVVVVDEPSFAAVEDEDGDAVDDDDDDEAGAAELFAPASAASEDEDDEAERPIVSPLLGSALFTDAAPQADVPPSFDQLLAAGSTGSIGTPNALIMSQATGGSPIVAPVTATGETIITGTFNLPEGLGSLGHAPGAADGHEADAVLVDGELPAHSSPTPIAASAAISTVKSNGDVIKPPAPEKGSKLMMSLAITAGVLALALVGVLILAFVNGVF